MNECDYEYEYMCTNMNECCVCVVCLESHLISCQDASQPNRIAELWILSFYTFFLLISEGCCELYGAPGIVSVAVVVVVAGLLL